MYLEDIIKNHVGSVFFSLELHLGFRAMEVGEDSVFVLGY